MDNIAYKELSENYKSLLASGKYSDLVITCGDDTYHVHKAIVCPRSGFFERAERFGKEAVDGRVDLPEDDPVHIKLLVQFLYEGDYDPKLGNEKPTLTDSALKLRSSRSKKGLKYTLEFPHICESPKLPPTCPHHAACTGGIRPWYASHDAFTCEICAPRMSETQSDNGELLLHTTLYALAEKYDIPSLKAVAREKFSRLSINFWNDDNFPAAAEHVLTTTPESDAGLREIVHEAVASHAELMENAMISELLSSHLGFAYGVLKLQNAQRKCSD